MAAVEVPVAVVVVEEEPGLAGLPAEHTVDVVERHVDTGQLAAVGAVAVAALCN